MDPLSITVSVVALLQLVGSAISYLGDFKEGVQGHQQLFMEVKSTWYILNTLNAVLQDDNLKGSWTTTMVLLQEPVYQMTVAFAKLNDELKPRTGIKKMGRAVLWQWKKEDVKEWLNIVERQKTMFVLAIQNDHVAMSRELQRTVTHGLQVLALGMGQIHVAQQVSRLQSEDQERQQILAWLSNLDFEGKQSVLRERRREGTCDWFLKCPSYIAWRKGDCQNLWCHGIPGAGKTVLSSIVIDNLKQQASADYIVAYIYCDYHGPAPQTVDNLAASILQQVASASSIICETIKLSFRTSMAGNVRPRFKELGALLQAQMKYCKKLYLVIDAMDELGDNNGQLQLVSIFRDLDPQPQVLITARPDVKCMLEKPRLITIRAHDHDVESYISDRIQNEPRLNAFITRSPDLKQAITQTILHNIQGMFLLARLYLDYLATQITPRKLREALSILPTTYEAMYDDIFKRIRSQDQQTSHQALQVLGWVTFARKPMSILEVSHALSTEEGDNGLYQEGIPDRDLLISSCAGIITVQATKEQSSQIETNSVAHTESLPEDSNNDILVVTHHTAQRYLRNKINHLFSATNREIAEACLRYLSFDVFQATWLNDSSNKRDMQNEYPFLPYAATYWSHHALNAPEPVMQKYLLQYLQNEGRRRSLMSAWHHRSLAFNRFGLLAEPNLPAIHVATYFNLEATVNELLNRGSDPNHRSANVTPLWLAVSQGHVSLVKLLLDRGADPNALSGSLDDLSDPVTDMPVTIVTTRSGQYYNHAEPAQIRRSILQLLLDRGANPEARRPVTDLDNSVSPTGWTWEDRKRFSAIEWATWNGDATSLSMLLDKVVEKKSSYTNGSFLLALTVEHGMVDEATRDLLLTRKDIGLDVEKARSMLSRVDPEKSPWQRRAQRIVTFQQLEKAILQLKSTPRAGI